MIGIAVAPEVGVALAMYQYLNARGALDRRTKRRETGSQHGELEKTESKDIESINIESKGVASKGTEPKDVELKDAQVTVLGVGRDEITMAHTFFADMGGFIARIRVLSLPGQDKTSSNKPDKTSSVPKTLRELILWIPSCGDLGQYMLSTSDTHSYRLWHLFNYSLYIIYLSVQ